jgi:hypothetical protein
MEFGKLLEEWKGLGMFEEKVVELLLNGENGN